MVRSCLGGTFDVLHRGHRALIETALRVSDEGAFIGVTSDEFAQRSRRRPVRRFEERVRDLLEFLRRIPGGSGVEVGEIQSVEGRALEPQFDTLVVTEETLPSADSINALRRKVGLPPLRVVIAPWVLAEDGRRLSATRIREGEIDPEGRLRRPLRIAVGSTNPSKVRGVERALRRVKREATLHPLELSLDIPSQPRGSEIWRGARERARRALERSQEGDWGVGVEAGLLEVVEVGRTFDVQACVVVDRAGRETCAMGPMFEHPRSILERVEREGISVGEAYEKSGAPEGIGRGMGAVGFLTQGSYTREELTEAAVLFAILPRLRADLYEF